MLKPSTSLCFRKEVDFICFITHQALALTVGVTAGPHAIIMEHLKQEAQKSGLDLTIIEFNDFIIPNAALASGDIDVNSYQHLPFLEEQIKSRGYKFSFLAKTILLPLGIYSLKHNDLHTIKESSKISIPNDPTNGGRALKLLEKAQLITLKSSENPSILDIVENPKRLQIIEVDAPQIPRTLGDVDYGITNTDWIVLAGMDPHKALLKEEKNSPYSNIIVVRSEDAKREDIQKLISLYHSKKTREFIIKEFKGSVLPAW